MARVGITKMTNTLRIRYMQAGASRKLHAHHGSKLQNIIDNGLHSSSSKHEGGRPPSVREDEGGGGNNNNNNNNNNNGEEDYNICWWVPHNRTGVYYPRGHERVMDDMPDGAASLGHSTFWLRNFDGVDWPHHP